MGNRSALVGTGTRWESRRFVLPALILHLLFEGRDHGHGIYERLEALAGEIFPVSPNRVYALLQQLEDAGLVQGEWDHPSKRTRRVYRLTSQGTERHDALCIQLASYVESQREALTSLQGSLAHTSRQGAKGRLAS